MPLSWNQPICERDWITRNSVYDQNGDLVSIRQPHLLVERELEQCSFCGELTIFGAYVREDPATVAFPKEKTA